MFVIGWWYDRARKITVIVIAIDYWDIFYFLLL
jgi:hypothetical protein